MNTGLIAEGRSIKDFAFSKSLVSISDTDRRGRAERLPVFYQNGRPECVLCSLDFISHWFRMDAMRPYVPIGFQGVKPSVALKAYFKKERIPNYLFLPKISPEAIFEALERSPLMIGVWNWFLVPGGHCMVALEKDGENILCLNWMNEHKHDFVSVPVKDTQIDFAVAFGDVDFKPRLPFPKALLWKIKTEIIALKRKLSYGKNP